MGRKLIQNKDFPQSYGNRFLPLYFKEIKSHEIEMVQIKMKSEDESKAEQIKQQAQAMEQFANQVSARNMADSNKSAEHKS